MSQPDPALPACCHPSADSSLAEMAYCAYNAAGDPATAGLNYRGEPCPTWADLPENIQRKWDATAMTLAVSCYLEAAKVLDEAALDRGPISSADIGRRLRARGIAAAMAIR